MGGEVSFMFSDKFSQKILKKDSKKDSKKVFKKGFKKDAGDLIQTVLIVSGVTVMCIVGLIPIGQSLANQAQEQNSCMSGSSNFVSSNFGNSCGEEGSSGSQLVITPGISDPYPVVVPTPTPTPTTTAPTTTTPKPTTTTPKPPTTTAPTTPKPTTTTPKPTTTTPKPTTPKPTTTTPKPAEDVNITPVSPFYQPTINTDLKKFQDAANDYYTKNGRKYPAARASELDKLNFKISSTHYPKNSPLNLEYCTVGDNGFVISTYLGNNKVVYIASNTIFLGAQTYTLSKTPKTNESLCESSAQKAGLTGKITGSTKGISVNNVPASWVN